MDEVPPHAHCRVCGKSVPVGDMTCSTACATKRAEAQRRRVLLNYAFYGIAFILIVLLAYSYHV